MSPALKLLMVGYFGGALIFAAWLLVVVLNVAGLTSLQLSVWPLFLSVGLMLGSKLFASRLLRRQEAKHG